MQHDCQLILIDLNFDLSGIGYFLVYRTKKYKTMRGESDTLTEQLTDLKKKRKSQRTPAQQKTIDKIDHKLKLLTRDLYMMQLPSNFILMLVFVCGYGFLSQLFDAFVIAKLPFEPFSLLTKLTHRNLPGNDNTDCAFVFMLVMCSMSIRASIKKFLGFSPKGQSFNAFMPEWEEPEPEEAQ